MATLIKKESQVRIVSDGTGAGTEIFVDGVKLTCVTKIEWEPVVCDKPVTCKLTMTNVAFDVIAKHKDE